MIGEQICGLDPLDWKNAAPIAAPDDAHRWERALKTNPRQNWVFRGLSSLDHRLTSTLDRCADGWAGRSEAFDKREELEAGIHRAFIRHAGLYRSAGLPVEDDLLGWLSLMRHYGAPTRLLDCSYSFWVATFFAVAEGSSADDAVVVAIDANWIDTAAESRMPPDAAKARLADQHGRHWKTFEAVYRHRAKRFVHRQNAWGRNERVTAQQGLFLVPSDVEVSFEQNLRDMFGEPGAADAVKHLRIASTARLAFLEHLHRGGIERRTMYPGELGHFAKSLGELTGIRHAIVPLDGQERWLGKGEGPT